MNILWHKKILVEGFFILLGLRIHLRVRVQWTSATANENIKFEKHVSIYGRSCVTQHWVENVMSKVRKIYVDGQKTTPDPIKISEKLESETIC